MWLYWEIYEYNFIDIWKKFDIFNVILEDICDNIMFGFNKYWIQNNLNGEKKVYFGKL